MMHGGGCSHYCWNWLLLSLLMSVDRCTAHGTWYFCHRSKVLTVVATSAAQGYHSRHSQVPSFPSSRNPSTHSLHCCWPGTGSVLCVCAVEAGVLVPCPPVEAGTARNCIHPECWNDRCPCSPRVARRSTCHSISCNHRHVSDRRCSASPSHPLPHTPVPYPFPRRDRYRDRHRTANHC
uniref:Putative secreted peptide n=1 Tax=Anopheles braziliensis TaxID=58242 RepID=A0A2M3ZP98_9DIPT